MAVENADAGPASEQNQRAGVGVRNAAGHDEAHCKRGQEHEKLPETDEPVHDFAFVEGFDHADGAGEQDECAGEQSQC